MSKFKPYPEYKDSGIEWVGNIPGPWETKPLKYLATYNDDSLSETTPRNFVLEYVDIGSVCPIRGVVRTEQLEFGQAPSRARRLVSEGDIIVSTVRTYLGAIAPIRNTPDNLVVSTGFAVIRPQKFFDSCFAAFCLKAKGFIDEVISLSVGVSYPAINASSLVDILLPLPSVTEQKQIALFLDHETARIDELIAEQKRLIELLKEKRQTVISHAVTKGLDPNAPMKDSGIEWLGEVPEHWAVIKNKYLLNFSGGLVITRKDLISIGIPCISYGDIHSKLGFSFNSSQDSLSSVADTYLESHPKALLDKGDFVFADTSEDLKGAGNFSYLKEGGPTFAGYHTIIGRLNGEHCAHFLAYAFDSQAHRTQIQTNVSGIKVFSITQGILKNTWIWLPPINEQKQIAEFLDNETRKIDALIQEAEKAIDLMNERRSALISAAVTGKIDVRDWQPEKEQVEALAS